MAPPREDTYGPYACVYNRLWGPRVPAAVWPALECWLLPELQPGDRVLDLCCGTGQICQALGERGYRAVGLDSSPAMLACARANAPEAELLLADARCFSLAPPCRGAISLSNSLNHMTTGDDLLAVFRGVFAALAPGSLFLFDVLLAGSFEPPRGTDVRMEEDYALIARAEPGADGELLHYALTLFYREGSSWRRWDTVASERLHHRRQVVALLRRAGFAEVRFLDASRQLGARGLGDRRYFRCRRPAAQRREAGG